MSDEPQNEFIAEAIGTWSMPEPEPEQLEPDEDEQPEDEQPEDEQPEDE